MAGEIFQWDINGFKCKRSPTYIEKIDTIRSILENNNSTLMLNIQETHIPSENELPKLLTFYKHIYHFEKTFSRNEDPYSGILICIRKTEEIISTEILEKGRLIYIKIQNIANKEIYNIFSIYCNSSNSEKQKALI